MRAIERASSDPTLVRGDRRRVRSMALQSENNALKTVGDRFLVPIGVGAPRQ